MTEKEIIDMLFARREEALRHLSQRCKAVCCSISRAILGNENDAEECFNDTLLRVWNNIPPDHPENLTAYVAKITRNLSLTRLARETAIKRGGGEYLLVYEELEDCLQNADDLSEQVVEKEALSTALDAFLSDLSDRNREIFLKRYFSFISSRELAKEYGMKESAMRMLLMRMREKLKEYLRRENVEL